MLSKVLKLYNLCPAVTIYTGRLTKQLTHSNSCISLTDQHIYINWTEMESCDLNNCEKQHI